MENQSIKLPLKSITKHAQRFNKALSAKNKLKKNFNKKAKAEICGYYMYFVQKKLNRELANYIKIKQQASINNELKKLKLAKLANNNISESDMLNIRQLVALPVKTLRQTAKLRNISQNLSKKDIIYALIRSEPIINEQKYIIDSNNECVTKLIKLDCNFLMYHHILTKKNVVILEKNYILLEKYKKLIES